MANFSAMDKRRLLLPRGVAQAAMADGSSGEGAGADADTDCSAGLGAAGAGAGAADADADADAADADAGADAADADAGAAGGATTVTAGCDRRGRPTLRLHGGSTSLGELMVNRAGNGPSISTAAKVGERTAKPVRRAATGFSCNAGSNRCTSMICQPQTCLTPSHPKLRAWALVTRCDG